MSCTHEALSPYTFDRGDDPTGTHYLQQGFAERLRGVLGRINARLREAIVTDDLFGLRDEALVDDVPEEVFAFPTDPAKVRGFLRWMREQLDTYFLGVVGPDANQFVRAAYLSGLRNANDQLDDLDVSFVTDTESILSRPIHRAALQELYTRTYENLVSVRDDTAQAVRDELVAGFQEGESPTKIARRLTDRVDSIGKRRSTMIARSEIIHAHTQGTLGRIEELNRDVGPELGAGHGRFDAADDHRTCPFCRRLDGTPLTVSEMSTGVVQFRGDVYRLGPPSHVSGRCNVSVIVGPDGIDTPLQERLPNGITVVS